MALQASGEISINNINVELGKAGTTQSSLGQSDFRTLAGVASGAISMSNFYGKANSVLITGTYHSMYVGSGIRLGIDVYSGTTPSVKNPTVSISMGGSNGTGETSDFRDYYVYAKRVSDGAWVQIFYQRNNNDVTAGGDSVGTSVTLSDGIYYNQFRCVMSGFGQNTYWCDSKVTKYWT